MKRKMYEHGVTRSSLTDANLELYAEASFAHLTQDKLTAIQHLNKDHIHSYIKEYEESPVKYQPDAAE